MKILTASNSTPLLSEAGKNFFTMSPTRWVNDDNAIGIRTKATKNGGTFAHRDIALEFASWISAEVKLYIIKELNKTGFDLNNEEHILIICGDLFDRGSESLKII